MKPENRKDQENSPSQAELAQKAAEIAASNAPEDNRPDPGRTADPGMTKVAHTSQAPSGALDHAGEKAARERSRERR